MSGQYGRKDAVTDLVFDARLAQQGAQQFEAAGQRVIQTNNTVTQATTRTADSQTALMRAIEAQTRRFDPAAAAAAHLAREQDKLDRAYQRGLVPVERYTRNMQLLQAHHDRQVQAAQRGVAANDNFTRALGQAQGAANSLAARLGPLGSILTALGPAGLAAAAGLGAITLGLGAGVRAAMEFETLGLRTAAVIRATGSSAGLTADQIRDMSQRIARETLASTAGVESAAAKLLTFRSIAGDTFERTLRAAQDLAATGFGSIDSAATQLGKALEDPVRGMSALAESGVTFTQSQRDVVAQLVATGQAAEAQRIILEAVEGQVAGAGRAQAGGLAGAYDSLSQNVQEFLVRVGNLGPIQLATNAINTLAGAVQALDGVLARLSGTESPVVAARRAMDGAEAAVVAVRGQMAAQAANVPAPARRGSTSAQAAFIAQGQVGALGSPDMQAALEAAVAAHAVAQAAFVAAVEDSQQAQTQAAVQGIQARDRNEREAATAALAAQRATMDRRIGIEQTYQTRIGVIQRALRAGALDQAAATRETAQAATERDRALAQLTAGSNRAAGATQRQTDAERELAREVERGVGLAQQTQTEAEKYADQLRALHAALEAGRIAQEDFNRAVQQLDPAQRSAREAAERATREAEQAVRRQEQEATRTTERITDFFASSFARAFEGTGSGFASLMQSFRRAAISTFASIAAQAVIRPIIAPIVSAFGGSGFGSMLGFGGGGSAAAGGGMGFGLDQIMSGVGLGRSLGGGSLFGSGGMFGGIGTSVNNFLSTPLYTPSSAFSPSNFGAIMDGTMAPMTVTAGSALGAIGGIGGGAFGIYSGIQKGGIGGAAMGLGGAAGIAAGVATLTGIGASLLPILGPAALLLPILGSLLPGQKPSTREQGMDMAFAPGSVARSYGLGGNRFSQSNADQASTIFNAIVAQERALSGVLGFNAAGGVDARVRNSRGEGPGTVQIRVGTATSLTDFENSEAGLRDLAARSSEMLFEAFREAANSTAGDMAGIVRGSTSMETLTANLEWFSTTYAQLSGTMARASELGNALIALQAPFTDAINRAREFGLSIDGLAANLNRTIQEFLDRTLREAQGRGYVDAVEGIVVSRGTAISALSGRDGSQLFDLAGLQLRALFAQLSPTQLLDALASTNDLQAQLIAQQVLAEMRAGAMSQQQDITDAAGGRNSLVAARTLLRDFEQYAPQMAALGLNAEAWARFTTQIQALVSDMPAEQLEFLAAFDHMTDRLEDDLIRGIAQGALDQRRAAEAQARAAEEQAEAQARAAREIERILAAGGSIRGFIDARRATAGPGGPSPMDALAEAQGQFGRDLTLAREGDMDALQRITGTADRLLGAGSAAFASGPQFQALREMTLSSLESLPVTRSYDAMILEALQALSGSVDVAVQVEMIRAITEQLNALPAEDRARLIQEGEVRRNIEQYLGRALSPAEVASLVQGGDITRNVAQIVAAASGASLIPPGAVVRDVLQNVETTETIMISRSIDDKLSGILSQVAFNTRLTHEHLSQYRIAFDTYARAALYGEGPNGGILVAARAAAHQNAPAWVKFADGGMVRGGMPGVDSVPALMMQGEGVLSTRGMAALGEATLNLLNAGRTPAASQDNSGLVAELRALLGEVRELRQERARHASAQIEGTARIAANTSRAAAASESTADSTARMARDGTAPVARRGAA